MIFWKLSSEGSLNDIKPFLAAKKKLMKTIASLENTTKLGQSTVVDWYLGKKFPDKQ